MWPLAFTPASSGVHAACEGPSLPLSAPGSHLTPREHAGSPRPHLSGLLASSLAFLTLLGPPRLLAGPWGPGTSCSGLRAAPASWKGLPETGTRLTPWGPEGFSSMPEYPFARRAITKSHRPGGLNNRTLFSCNAGGLKSKTQVWAGLDPPQPLSPAGRWPSQSHGTLPPHTSVSKCPLLIRTPI